MLIYRILFTFAGMNYYLWPDSSDVVVFTSDTDYDSSQRLRWTIDQISDTGAYRICNVYFSGNCLAIAEGRNINKWEAVTLAKADSANPVYWIFNRTDGGTIRPYDHPLYLTVVNSTQNNFLPIRLDVKGNDQQYFRLEGP